MKKVLFVALLLLPLFLVQSQNTAFPKADSLQLLGQHDLALELRAEHIRSGGATAVDSLKFLGNSALALIDQGGFDQGMTMLDSLWRLKDRLPQTGDNLVWLNRTVSYYYGVGLQMRGYDFSKQIADSLQQILQRHTDTILTPEKKALVMDLRYLASYYRDYNNALKYQTDFFELALAGPEIDTMDIAVSYNNIAGFYDDLGDLEKAKTNYSKAYRLSVSQDDSDDPFEHIHLAGNYVNVLLDYGDFIEARRVKNDIESKYASWKENKALGKSMESPFMPSYKAVAELYILLPLVRYYVEIGNQSQAELYFSQMAQLVQEIKMPNCEALEPFFLAVLKMERIWKDNDISTMVAYAEMMQQYNCLHNASVQKFMIGRAYFNTQNYEAMEAIFKDIELLGLDYFEVFQARVYYYLALAEKAQYNDQAYLDYLSKALAFHLANESIDLSTYEEPLFNDSNSLVAIHNLTAIATELKQEYLASKTQALKGYLCAIQSELLRRFQAIYDQGYYNEKLYEELSNILDLILDQPICDVAPSLLLTQIEKVHSQKLYNDYVKKSISRVPIDFKKDLATLQKDVQRRTRTDTIADTNSAQNKKELWQFALNDWTLEQLQNEMAEGDVILRYFLGARSVYAFVITSDQVKLHQLGSKAETVEHIEENRRLIYQRDDAFRTSSKALYESLLQPLLGEIKSLKNLRIVNEDELSYLSYASLINDKGIYVIQENYQMSYDFSLPLLEARLKKKPIEDSFLVFTNSYQNSDATLASLERSYIETEAPVALPYALAESKNIASVFDAEIISGAEANKETFSSVAKDYDVIHLAMHAITSDKKRELQSALLFDDGAFLTYDEIQNLSLDCALVTVSACSSGVGALEKGEDLQSLAQAFTYAGANATITTLWNVNDQSTSEIMVGFYNNVHQGVPLNESLKNAQLAYLTKYQSEDQALSHPYYWSAFVLGGNTQVLFESDNTLTYILIALGVLLLGAILLLSRKRSS